MKEVLAKSFLQGVKKTFNEALEGPSRPTKVSALQSSAAENPEAPSNSDKPLSTAARVQDGSAPVPDEK